ncbi:MAG: rRNA maturation RNase YbeY [Thermodesulfobacteriota bacterium]
MLKHLNISNNSEICISFIDDKEMRILNKKYKNIDKTTDVLSFIQDGDLLGDVVISYETAKKHAQIYKTTAESEIKRLLIHGVLHLLGFDHKKKNEREVMREKERELFNNTSKLDLQP